MSKKKKEQMRVHLYRIEVTDKRGRRYRHLAQIRAVLDETGRRKIIHQTLAEGGQVHSITATDDAVRYSGEKAKRHYGNA